MGVAVVLLAAGRGERLGAGKPKALVEVSGKTLIEHSLQNVLQFHPDQIVVVVPSSHLSEFTQIVHSIEPNAELVVGGESRQESARAGVAVVSHERVLIHDSARAFAPASVFSRVAEALNDATRSVIPGLPVYDTIKRVAAEVVVETPARSDLRRVQTPQGFFTDQLRHAYTSATEDFTDDAGLLESLGVMPKVVPGDEMAAKVTTPADLEAAQRASAAHSETSLRSGIGTDAHRFGDTGTLRLGCIDWPDYPRLEGHSDGDAMAHAIVDALLSAAELGDIGSNFGTDRPEFAAAAGEVFLKGAQDLLAAQGYRVVNVAVQVVADRPKIGPRREELQHRLSQVVGAPVAVSATTTDGLGFLSDTRGVGCVATALIERAG